MERRPKRLTTYIRQRTSIWDASGNLLNEQVYWGGTPVAFFADGPIYYHHQDWLGTERMRTTYNGMVEGSYQSLPFGDGLSTAGSDNDAYHFAGLDHDPETDTDYAWFRQYGTSQGRWMSPDPYNGSYDLTNPQSLNRYAYVLNNPMVNFDPLGLSCVVDANGNWADNGDGQGCSLSGPAPLQGGDGGGGNGPGGGAPDPCAIDPSSCTYVYSGPMLDPCAVDPLSCTIVSSTATVGYDPTSNSFVGFNGFGYGFSFLPVISSGGNAPKKGKKGTPLSSKEKAGMIFGCLAGMDPSYAAPLSLTPGATSPTDPLNSTQQTSGQRTVPGPTPSGSLTPYNPSGSASSGPDAAANGASYLVNVIQCISNVLTAWPE